MKGTRWILAAVCLSVLIGCGGARDIDVSGQYKDRGIFGRRFETKVAFIVAKAKDSEFPELTNEIGTLKINEIKEGPFDYYGYTVYGVLPGSARFEIVGARRSTSRDMGEDYFTVRILTGSFQGKEVGARFLKPFGTNDIFDPKYAVEVTTGTK